MRIISGTYRGKNIIAPKSLPVRPTTDFAKTALFNILNNRFDFSEISVLDLFCGTGNISYEFFSRGCEKIICVDKNFHCVQFVKDTFEKLNFTKAQVIKSDVFAFINHCSQKFDVIFADPPFEMKEANDLPELIFKKNILNDSGLFILEHSSSVSIETSVLKKETRTYGNVAFSIFER